MNPTRRATPSLCRCTWSHNQLQASLCSSWVDALTWLRLSTPFLLVTSLHLLLRLCALVPVTKSPVVRCNLAAILHHHSV